MVKEYSFASRHALPCFAQREEGRVVEVKVVRRREVGCGLLLTQIRFHLPSSIDNAVPSQRLSRWSTPGSMCLHVTCWEQHHARVAVRWYSAAQASRSFPRMEARASAQVTVTQQLSHPHWSRDEPKASKMTRAATTIQILDPTRSPA